MHSIKNVLWLLSKVPVPIKLKGEHNQVCVWYKSFAKIYWFIFLSGLKSNVVNSCVALLYFIPLWNFYRQQDLTHILQQSYPVNFKGSYVYSINQERRSYHCLRFIATDILSTGCKKKWIFLHDEFGLGVICGQTKPGWGYVFVLHIFLNKKFMLNQACKRPEKVKNCLQKNQWRMYAQQCPAPRETQVVFYVTGWPLQKYYLVLHHPFHNLF